MGQVITRQLVDVLHEQFLLDWQGIHGIKHWSRVRHHGLTLGKMLGVNLRVIELFAFLHDSRRQNEGFDIGHGHRSADYALWPREHGYIDLNDDELDLLQLACRGHSNGHTEADVTVQVCWDADRLDLGRVGIRPDPLYLCTEPAKDETLIENAWRWSLGLKTTRL